MRTRASNGRGGYTRVSGSDGECDSDHSPSLTGSKGALLESRDGLRPLGASPLLALRLCQAELLNNCVRWLLHRCIVLGSRVLPALAIWGGTACMLICVFFQYRWGLLLSLTMYSYFCCYSAWCLAIFSGFGLAKCWVHQRTDWQGLYQLEVESEAAEASSRPLGVGKLAQLEWEDVFHLVFVTNYNTPLPILEDTLRSLQGFTYCSSQLGVCLACEERESDVRSKVEQLRQTFHGAFRFISATYHPSNMPGHIKGKSSNMCWAFQAMIRELGEDHGFSDADQRRILITVVDDDSQLHGNYFDCLQYKFLRMNEKRRHLSIWQCPVVQFRNYLTQPIFVRINTMFSAMGELACLANQCDCHIPFSSYSMSLVLVTAVGGFDPDWVAEDWHNMAKCCVMTEGRVRCEAIFLPMLNYAPEDDSYWSTVQARWVQANRHALGVSEFVYVSQALYLATIEVDSCWRSLKLWWRVAPLIGKFLMTHIVNATMSVWPMLATVLISYNKLWRSFCSVSELQERCENCCLDSALRTGLGEDQVVRNSIMAQSQKYAFYAMILAFFGSGGMGAVYLTLVKSRINGHRNWCLGRYPFLLWMRVQIEIFTFGWITTLAFISFPEWLAALKIVYQLKVDHAVAAMLGRQDHGSM